MGAGKTYTSEENTWIKEVYPSNGAKKTYELFQARFGRKPGWHGFLSHLSDIGAKVTEDRWREACKNNGVRTNASLGTVVRRGRGENYIKVADGTKGWIPLKRHIVGTVREDQLIVHLDRNKDNDSPENLMVIDRKTSATLTGCNMWSENSEITKTAVMWCKLKQIYEDQATIGEENPIGRNWTNGLVRDAGWQDHSV